MRKYLFLISLFLSIALVAQEPQRLQRTPQEEARTQTERLVRELGISDSVRVDTIYRMHLKYAKMRQVGLSRQENLDRMQAIYGELKQLLTPEEFERFMSHPAELPRRPRGAKILAPNAEMLRRQPAPKENQ